MWPGFNEFVPKNFNECPFGDVWCEYGDTGVCGRPTVGGEIECCDTGVNGGGVSVKEVEVGGIWDGDVEYALLTEEITVGGTVTCCCCFEDRSAKIQDETWINKYA